MLFTFPYYEQIKSNSKRKIHQSYAINKDNNSLWNISRCKYVYVWGKNRQKYERKKGKEREIYIIIL